MNKIRKARDITYIGLMGASLTAVKFALSWLANVELVTLLLVFYTLKMGKGKALCACNIFIVVECFLFGIGFWVISYILHWNTLVIMIFILDKFKVKKNIYYALSCLVITFLFGVQTTFIEVLFFSPSANFFPAFLTKYFMGLTFFITHICSTFFSVLLLLPPLLSIKFDNSGQEKDN